MKAKEVRAILGIDRVKLYNLYATGYIGGTLQADGRYEYDEESVLKYKSGVRENYLPVISTVDPGIRVQAAQPLVNEERLTWLFDLYSAGYEIGSQKKMELIDAGFIKESKQRVKLNNGKIIKSIDDVTKELYKREKERKKELAKLVEKDEIDSREWMPLPIEEKNYPDEFIRWIDSINSGFLNRIPYERFNKYVLQSKIWIAKNDLYENCKTRDERWEFVVREKNRIQQNTLYFLDKYVRFKDDKSTGGSRKYIAYDAQQVLLFLTDSGYNLMIGKGRQIFFTTTMGAIMIKKTNFHRSHFIKFITHDKKKGEEIFEDKIKFSFYSLPDWIKCSVSNDRDGLFKISRKIDGKKGTRGGADSRILVGVPNEIEINGGSPTMVLLDEVGMINNLSSMINEVLPTLYAYDYELKRLKLVRQLIGWGTGGDMEKGGDAFETEFRAALNMWSERKFSSGVVPVFFDFFARPGVTQEYYDEQKAIYYEKWKISGQIKFKVQFHQHHPITIEDMFLRNAETIIPLDTLNDHIKRINLLPVKQKPQYGYFEPIYDTSVKLTGYVPFRIRGANFIPTSDIDDRTTTVIVNHPEQKWLNRYYKGTDPIFAKSGHSKFSSAIWDAKENTVSACLNHRTHDYRYDYLQSVLLGVYYGHPQELPEFNVGGEYINMVDELGLYNTLIPQTMLPDYLQMNSAEPIGIGKKAGTSRYITNKLLELMEMHAGNIRVNEFFIQLKTFVRKTTQSGIEVFKVDDPKYYFDDVIDSITYAYIASICFSHLKPINTSESAAKTTQMRYVCNKSTNWNTILVPVEVLR